MSRRKPHEGETLIWSNVLKSLLLISVLCSNVLAAQQEPMQVVNVGTRPVAYHVLGDAEGTPLVFINGGPGFDHSFHHLSTVWERLATARRVVFFDQPGTGQSWPVGPEDVVRVDDLLLSIETIRTAIGASRVAVLGHSWGGYVALAYAIRYPDRVERLVLVSSVAPKISATEFLFGSLFPDVHAVRRGLRGENPDDVQKYIRLSLAMSFYSPENRERILAKLGPVAYNGRQETLLWRDAESRDLTSDLRRLTMPVLLATGRFDANVAPRTTWSIHQVVPGSQLAVFERSGHFPMIEEPDRFFAVVDKFLRGR